MNEIILSGLLMVIAAQTSYLVWRQHGRSLTRRARPIFIDTSVLMDGRIVSIAESGFLAQANLVIPRSVILELQLLADKSDHEKRERARYGLDVVAELQAIDGLNVTVLADGKPSDGVDERLIELAKQRRGSIMTIDFNLNKVAATEEIAVLNPNDLARGLRMAHLPGEKMTIELVEKGQNSKQAVGYLTDGTMVVVEQAASKLGQTVTVECIRSLQTAAGRMMFARLVAKPTSPTKKSTASAQEARVTTPASGSLNKRTTSAAVQPSTAKPKRPATKSKRPPSSRQREAALIELVEQQRS